MNTEPNAVTLVVASVGGWNKPSTAYRVGPLERAGYPISMVEVGTIPSRSEIERLMSHSGHADILILRRVLPSRSDIRMLRQSFQVLLFDMDDAIYAVAPRAGESYAAHLVRNLGRFAFRGSTEASSRARPLRSTLREVDACVVGNSILAEFATRYASTVVEIPTTIELPAHEPRRDASEPIIVWLGVPANLQYLDLIADALKALRRMVDFRLRVVSSHPPRALGVPVEFVEWSPTAAQDALLSATVGIAPLTDNAWTRGKCAFRAIQYGAHGLPTVASPIGITSQIVIPDVTGYLAESSPEWTRALERLLQDPSRAAKLGANARDLVARRYSDDVAVARWRGLINESPLAHCS